MIRTFVPALAALLLAGAALAAEVGGVKLDDKVSVGGKDLVLNGAGIRTRAIFKVYVGSLYVPQKSGDLAGVLAGSPRRIQMNILRDLTADQLVDALVEGSEGQPLGRRDGRDQGADRPAGDDAKAFQQVKEKDVVTLDFVGDATQIALNGNARLDPRRAVQHRAHPHLAGRQAGAGRSQARDARLNGGLARAAAGARPCPTSGRPADTGCSPRVRMAA
jgi:long-chain acyl-CoA synthetase